MGNVTVPTPVFVAGGALCLLGGYLIGVVAGPDAPNRTTALVASYESSDNRLCLKGEAVKDAAGLDPDGRLCGTWRRSSASATVPTVDADFRFVVVTGRNVDRKPTNLIYGDVVS